MLISEPAKVTAGQMERWVRDFENWDVCDGTCCHLFAASKLAWSRAFAWSKRRREFEKRAGFALVAYLAVHDKQAENSRFEEYLKAIEREARDS
jgi:3-methyladenine DNA glycosylase AlkD